MGMVSNDQTYVGPPPKEIAEQCPLGLRHLCYFPLSDPIIRSSMNMALAISLCGVMASLRVFGREKLVFLRESQTGLSTLAYFIAKDLSTIASILIGPLMYLLTFYSLTAPRAPCKLHF